MSCHDLLPAWLPGTPLGLYSESPSGLPDKRHNARAWNGVRGRRSIVLKFDMGGHSRVAEYLRMSAGSSLGE
jgi:hypothetical protein